MRFGKRSTYCEDLDDATLESDFLARISQNGIRLTRRQIINENLIPGEFKISKRGKHVLDLFDRLTASKGWT